MKTEILLALASFNFKREFTLTVTENGLRIEANQKDIEVTGKEDTFTLCDRENKEFKDFESLKEALEYMQTKREKKKKDSSK